jgi:hypothetical protein
LKKEKGLIQWQFFFLNNIFRKLQQDLLIYFENDTIKVKINFDALQEEKTTENPVEKAENTEGIYFYHPDHLGSATFLTDKIGNPYSFYLNLPFGEIDEGDSSNTYKNKR